MKVVKCLCFKYWRHRYPWLVLGVKHMSPYWVCAVFLGLVTAKPPMITWMMLCNVDTNELTTIHSATSPRWDQALSISPSPIDEPVTISPHPGQRILWARMDPDYILRHTSVYDETMKARYFTESHDNAATHSLGRRDDSPSRVMVYAEPSLCQLHRGDYFQYQQVHGCSGDVCTASKNRILVLFCLRWHCILVPKHIMQA